MLEHLRQVVVGLSLLLTVLAAVRAGARLAAVRERSRIERAETLSGPAAAGWVLVAGALAGVAWIFAGSASWVAPTGSWTLAYHHAAGWLAAHSPAMLAGCVGYFLVVLITNTGLIGIPRYRLLQSRVGALESVLVTSKDTEAVHKLIGVVQRARDHAAWHVGELVLRAPLTSIFRATRELNAAEIQSLCLLSAEQLRLYAHQVAIRLAGTGQAADVLQSLRAKLRNPTISEATDVALRAECVSALATIYAATDIPAEQEAERIRVGLWLTLVGLGAVLGTNAVLGRDEVFLAGALGGLLGSLAGLMRRQTLSLELIILSPVSGALNAIGGVMLVGFLASANVKLLGETLGTVWTAAGSVEALALSLLLGFSGGLFARLAMTGSSYLLAPLGRPGAAGGKEAAPQPTGPAVANGHADRLSPNGYSGRPARSP